MTNNQALGKIAALYEIESQDLGLHCLNLLSLSQKEYVCPFSVPCIKMVSRLRKEVKTAFGLTDDSDPARVRFLMGIDL